MALLDAIICFIEQYGWVAVMVLAVLAICICAALDPDNQRKEGDTYDPDNDYFGL